MKMSDVKKKASRLVVKETKGKPKSNDTTGKASGSFSVGFIEKGPTCYYCKEMGHLKTNCSMFKKWLKMHRYIEADSGRVKVPT